MKIALGLAGILAAAVSAGAAVVTKSVAYEQGGVKLEGYLAYDDSSTKPRPGVLVYPEWWGLNDYAKDRARQLAQLGYVAFAADMYGGGLVTEDPKQAGELSGQFYGKPLAAERARAALDQLVKTGLVDPQHIAAIGFCFGGAISQALAYSGAPLVGIVSFHGSLVPAPSAAASNNHARFLICHGALDPFEKPEDIAAFKKSLDDGGFDYQLVYYSGAMHSFTNPGADAMAAKTGLKALKYNEPAARRSWALMQQFLHEVFGQ
jgi:dienelactone hydrolase